MGRRPKKVINVSVNEKEDSIDSPIIDLTNQNIKRETSVSLFLLLKTHDFL